MKVVLAAVALLGWVGSASALCMVASYQGSRILMCNFILPCGPADEVVESLGLSPGVLEERLTGTLTPLDGPAGTFRLLANSETREFRLLIPLPTKADDAVCVLGPGTNLEVVVEGDES